MQTVNNYLKFIVCAFCKTIKIRNLGFKLIADAAYCAFVKRQKFKKDPWVAGAGYFTKKKKSIPASLLFHHEPTAEHQSG